MRFLAALWCAKLVQIALRLLGRNATYLAGKIAIKLCPDFLGRIGKPETIIGVTGTNGKTTVNNMLTDALEKMSVKVLSNRYGSNIDAGIATALVSGSCILGRTKYPVACLEIDERSARLIYPYIKPDYLIITNLFRDSMRRNAHPEYIASILTEYIPEETQLVLNANDVISSMVSPHNKRVYFGIEKLEGEIGGQPSIVRDAELCPVCMERLEYTFRRYNHIGKVNCPSCGFASPKADFLLTHADSNTMRMTVNYGAADYSFKLGSELMHNIYNQLAVTALLFTMGYTPQQVLSAMENTEIVKSRYDKQEINGKPLYVVMAKGQNAVACSRSFDFVSSSPGKKSVFLVLDDVFDEKKSSENIAWLYDADFEFLCSPDIVQIIVLGVRRLDVKLRLLIAGIPENRIAVPSNEQEAVKSLNDDDCGSIFVLYELYRAAEVGRLRDRIKEYMLNGKEQVRQ